MTIIKSIILFILLLPIAVFSVVWSVIKNIAVGALLIASLPVWALLAAFEDD